MFLVGPLSLRLLFHGFVVLVGTLILAGAVNTAIIGSNGVLNRVAEDGVLPDWFRHPHTKFGTTQPADQLIVILQIVTIVISRGDVYLLGEAYAFGVVWSFAMKALSRAGAALQAAGARGVEGAAEFPISGKTEIPVGLGLITICSVLAGHHQRADEEGGHHFRASRFTLAFFIVFELSEKLQQAQARRRAARRWRNSAWTRPTI